MGREYRWRAEQLWAAGSDIEIVSRLFPTPPGSAWRDYTYEGRPLLVQTRPSYAKRGDHPLRFLVQLADGRIVSVTAGVPPFHDICTSRLAPDALETALAEAAVDDAKRARQERIRAAAWWNKD